MLCLTCLTVVAQYTVVDCGHICCFGCYASLSNNSCNLCNGRSYTGTYYIKTIPSFPERKLIVKLPRLNIIQYASSPPCIIGKLIVELTRLNIFKHSQYYPYNMKKLIVKIPKLHINQYLQSRYFTEDKPHRVNRRRHRRSKRY